MQHINHKSIGRFFSYSTKHNCYYTYYFWVQYLYIFGEHYIKGANRWWRTKRQTINVYTGWPQKSKPLPNNKKILLDRIKACQW